MKKSTNKILLVSGIIGLLLIILILLKRNIITLLCHSDFFHHSFNKLQIKLADNVNIFNFQLSINDMQFLNSNEKGSSYDIKIWQEVNLNINNKKYRVEISHFENYFKKFQPIQTKQPLSIRFPANNCFNQVRQYDLFQLQEIDLFEQELVYDLGKRLHLYIPKTQVVQILFDYSCYGLYTLKQAFDKVFLDQHHLDDSIIFRFNKSEKDKYSLSYLYDEQLDEETRIHLEQFLKLLEIGDKNLLIKYFDLDYLTRFEALRRLLKARMNFVIAENLRYIYSKSRGKLYPILDEANILNMRCKSKNQELKKLTHLIKNDPVFQQRTDTIITRLSNQSKEIIQFHNKSEKKFRGLMRHIIYRLKINLVSEFFSKNIYKKILTDSFPKYRITKKSLPYNHPLKSVKYYLDQQLLTTDFIVKNDPDFNLELEKNEIVLSPGIHILKRSLIIPYGTVLKISAGARIKVLPQVSLICYSPVLINGSREEPVVIEAFENNDPFGVFAFIGHNHSQSEIYFLDYSGSSTASISGSSFTGGIYFQDMDVKIFNSKIHHIHSSSGIKANGCSIFLKNNQFQPIFSDHLYLENCQGTIEENIFFYNGEESGIDGLKIVHSDLLVKNNQFEKFQDKGIIISQNSHCIFFKNDFRFNVTGLAVKDSSSALIFSNSFFNNRIGISSYQKNPAFEGGRLYILDNTFENNNTNLTHDRHSFVFLPPKSLSLKIKISKSIEDQKHFRLSSVFNHLKHQFPFQNNQIQSLQIGDHPANINEREKTIFVRLPFNSPPNQKISFECKLKNTHIYITPLLQGIQENKEKTEEIIKNHSTYDFGAFIFLGKISLKNKYLSKEYDLYITNSNLALITINTRNKSGQINEIKNEPKIPCTIGYLPSNPKNNSPVAFQKFFGRIEGRGQKWPKWKYGFILDRTVRLEDMARAKKWVLESSFVEKSLMRSKITFDLLRQFQSGSDQTRISPRSTFVEVILNQKYNGIYLLTEHINKNFIDLEDFDKNEKYNAFLYRAKNRNANFTSNNFEPVKDNIYSYFPGEKQPVSKADDPIRGWHSGFAQRHPDPDQYGEHWEAIEDLSKFLALAPDELFQSEVFNVLDMNSYINLWILIQLTDDTDGIFQNRYMARSKGNKTKWIFIPWDKDGVLGRNYKMEKRPYNEWLTSPLFERCMKLDIFKNSFIKRWEELTNTGIISTDNIFKMIKTNKERLKDCWQRNFQKWPAHDTVYPDSLDFDQEIDFLKTWIGKRIKWLDQYLNELAKEKVE